jgi:hypothetical protein
MSQALCEGQPWWFGIFELGVERREFKRSDGFYWIWKRLGNV